MELTILETRPDLVRAGYACPCGCQPDVTYRRGSDAAQEGCCCGNEFVIGPTDRAHLEPRDGFRLERTQLMSWNERLAVAWLVGPSLHPEAGHEHEHHPPATQPGESSRAPATAAIDPVCGMTVDPEAAREKGLHSRYRDVDYFFCGRGCKLDFEDDPERYLDPSYVPSM
jgi:YHS domain-containing protein